MAIDRKWIDVDFENEPQECGLMPQTDEEVMRSFGPMASFETSYPELMIPQSQRKELALKKWPMQRRSLGPRKNQKRTSACVGFGSAKALENAIRRKYGIKNGVETSGMDVYKDIGRTLMSGAMISDGMDRIVTVGAMPLDTPANRAKFGDQVWANEASDYSKRRPSNYPDKCPMRVAKFAKAQGQDEIESALLSDFLGIVGRSSHCINYCGLMFDGNDSFVPYDNSWGSDWGDDGIGYDSVRTYRNLTLYLILEVVVISSISVPNI